jgi:hypothetical protein
MPRLVFAILLLALAGCRSTPAYFRITDPQTGRVYYTEGQTAGRYHTGAIQFRDARTGANVTLVSSEIQRIAYDEFLSSIQENAEGAEGTQRGTE